MKSAKHRLIASTRLHLHRLHIFIVKQGAFSQDQIRGGSIFDLHLRQARVTWKVWKHDEKCRKQVHYHNASMKQIGNLPAELLCMIRH